jgi:outer membrane lipoprotein SlyB
MKRVMLICSILSLVTLSGCSNHQSHERSYDRSYSDRHYSDREVRSSVHDNEEYATVTDIDLVTVDKSSGGGAVLGAVIGGVLGHQLPVP